MPVDGSGLTNVSWRRGSRSNGESGAHNCVEVAVIGGSSA